MRKKILFINCSDSGSTGTIIKDIVLALNQTIWDSYLCVPRITSDVSMFKDVFEVSMKFEQGIYYRVSKHISNPLGFAPLSTFRIKRVIRILQPDIIHVHCINSYMCNVYEILQYIKGLGVPVVITNHAEFYYTGSCAHANECNQWVEGCMECPQLNKPFLVRSYWNRMKSIFSTFHKSVVTSVSPWVMSRSSASGIMHDVSQMVIENGVNTNIFRPSDANTLRDTLGISGNTKIILHVTALYSLIPGHPKGGEYISELASRFKGENVFFLVVGNYYEKNDTDNIKFCGRVISREELARYYSVADVTVLVSKRETFSMPLAESLCCGTPVVGFEAGGPESIALSNYTSFCSYGDIDALERILRNDGLYIKDKFGKQISIDAIKKYDSRKMCDNYQMLYKELLNI